MTYALGVVLFALGILISLVLHEAGHLGAARMFGMKVTRFFVGFGPTLWSFRRRETEYGIKAIPAGAFVKIVGMTRQTDDVDPADEPRAMWRYPLWKRTIVMSAGSLTHFALGALILWGLFAFVPLPDVARLQSEPVRVGSTSPCVQATWGVDPATKRERQCQPGAAPPSAAAQLGLRRGDVITAIDGQVLRGWDTMTAAVRAAGGRQVEVSYLRDGQHRTAVVTLPLAERVRLDVVRDPSRSIEDITPADLEQVGVLGVTPIVPTSAAGPLVAVGRAADQTGQMFSTTLHSLRRVPQKIPALWSAVTGGERDPETPISMVGASRIGGELSDRGEWPTFFLLLAALNFFVGVFNLLPLLPVDGGHIAISWFERARSLLYRRLGRPDPGLVDYLKLMPLTYAVILIFAGFTLLTLLADIINPITLPD